VLALVLRVPQTPPVLVPPVPEQAAAVAPPTSPSPAEPARPVKIEEESGPRAKPVTGAATAAAPSDRKSQPMAVTPSEQQFQVVDSSGYAHTLEEYRGHVVVIAVWSP